MHIGTYSGGSALRLSNDDRQRHIYITGASGTGKTTLLARMMRADLAAGRPFAFLDPHGDEVQYIADSVPKHLTRDTLYFDPLDDHVIGYNPMRPVPVLERSQLTDDIVATFRNRWSDSWGPRMEHILRNAIRLLLDNDGTLLEIPLVLASSRYRERLLRRSTDPFNLRFWTEEYAGYTDRFRTEVISPIENKTGTIVGDANLRTVFGQQDALNLSDLINCRKFLLCNLSKVMGAEPSALLGSFLATGFAQAAQARATVPQSERRDFTLYVDEFQNFASPAFATILSEARKYRLNLVLANQFAAQLPEEIRDAVLGNVSTMIVFRVSAKDAAVLAPELGHPNPAALAGTPNFHAIVRHGTATPEVVRMRDKPPPLGRLAAVRARSRATRGVPRQKIEAQITRMLRDA